jgi:hypothetical protein
MSSNALESQGITIAIAVTPVGSPIVYTAIPDAKDINFRTGSAAVIDTTDLSSSAKEKRMGLADEGQCTFTLNFIPKETTHAELVAAKRDRQKRKFQVELTDASPSTIYEFEGYVLSVPISASVDAVIESSVTIEITGEVTEA